MGEQKEQRGTSYSPSFKTAKQKKIHPLLVVMLILVGLSLINILSEGAITGFIVFSNGNPENLSAGNESGLDVNDTLNSSVLDLVLEQPELIPGPELGTPIPPLQIDTELMNKSDSSGSDNQSVLETNASTPSSSPTPSSASSSESAETSSPSPTSNITLQSPEFFPQFCVGPSADCDAACGVGLGYKETVSQACFTDNQCTIACSGGTNAPPNVSQVSPINANTYELSSKVNVTATVTDSGTISIVYANITRPKITLVYRINMTGSGSNKTQNYTVHNISGQYNVTFFANDTDGASNKSITTRFNVTDTTPPPVTDPKPVPAAKSVQVDTAIAIGANATDMENVSTSPLPHANITRPNVSQTYQLNLTQQAGGGGINFSKSYRVLNVTGLHNFTFFFKDNTGNINKTITSSLTAVDTVGPIVSDSTPPHSQSKGVNTSINLSINATDALNISIVYANITRPSITLPFRINLTREGATNNFSARYKIHNITGLYNVSFFVNDTRGNVNFTNSTNISITDAVAPSARYRAPVPQSSKEANSSIGVSFNMSELVNISTAYVNISRPNISTLYRLNLSLGQASGPLRNMSALYRVQRTLGKYNLTFWANDLSGNILSSTTLNFTNITVVDTAVPGVIARGPTPQSAKEINGSLMVSWNLSEVVNISTAYVNVSRPNITAMYRLNLTLGQNVGDTRNMSVSYLVHRTPGKYNLTVWANDTSGNILSSTTLNFSNFTAQDTTAPTANKRGPSPQSSKEVNSSVVFSLNVTELSNLSLVYANVSRPNISTIYRLNMTTLSKETPAERNQTGTYVVQRTPGKYNVTFFAVDSRSNILSSTTLNFTNFTAVDTTAPVILYRVPAPQSSAEINATMGVSINMTEIVNISIAYVNISRPNITTPYRLNLTLGQNSLDLRNLSASYVLHRTPGKFNFTFFANDISGNIISSTTLNFTNITAQDTTAPTANKRGPAPQSSFEANASISLSLNMTELSNLSTVYANITRPNISTVYRLNMTTLSKETPAERNQTGSYVIQRTTGKYNVTFYAADSRNNLLSSTTLNFTNFTVTDTTAPSVIARGPTPQSAREINASISVSWNLSEIVNISLAYANITRPNVSTIYRLNLTLGQNAGDTRNMSASYIVQRTPGKYNLTVWANDTSGNILSSTTLNFSNFTAQDTTAPGIIARGPTPQSSREINASISVSWNLSEIVNISLAYANITRPNVSTVYRLNLTLGQTAGDTRNMSASYIVQRTPGKYNLTVWANDTSGNIISNTALNFSNFTAQDTIAPVSLFVAPVAQTTKEANTSIGVSINLTEVVNLSIAYINITRPNIGDVYRVNLTLGQNTGDRRNMSGTYNVHGTLGKYNMTFFANDTSGNVISTTTLNFTNITVTDTAQPRVFDSSIAHRSSQGQASTLEIAINATDGVNTSVVTANITRPSGGTTVLNLSLKTGNRFNASYTTPSSQGEYNITYSVNDTTNNRNRTTSVVFNVSVCGVISSTTTLNADLNVTSSCFTVTTSSITLDCGGKRIKGIGTGFGINLSSANNVTIANCVFENFSHGVMVRATNGTKIVNSTFVGNGNGDIFANNSQNFTYANTQAERFNFTQIPVVTENETYGRVQFTANANITGSNYTNHVQLRQYGIFVDSRANSALNVSANLTFYNIPFNNPVLLADFNDNGTFKSCSSAGCTRLPSSRTTPQFSVNHFTEYRVFEGPGDQSRGGGDSGARTIRSTTGGGGGSGGGGPQNKNQNAQQAAQQTSGEVSTSQPAQLNQQSFASRILDKMISEEKQAAIQAAFKENLVGSIVGNVVKDLKPAVVSVSSQIPVQKVWLVLVGLSLLLVVTIFVVPNPQKTFIDEASLRTMTGEGMSRSFQRRQLYVTEATKRKFPTLTQLVPVKLNEEDQFKAGALAKQHDISQELASLLLSSQRYQNTRLMTQDNVPVLLADKYRDVQIQKPQQPSQLKRFALRSWLDVNQITEHLKRFKMVSGALSLKKLSQWTRESLAVLHNVSAERKEHKLMVLVKEGRLKGIPTDTLLARLNRRGWDPATVQDHLAHVDASLQKLITYIKAAKFQNVEGMRDRELVKHLLAYGWSYEEVHYGLSFFNQKVQRLVDYVRRAQLNKIPEATIRSRLRSEGWAEAEIEEDLSLLKESTDYLVRYITHAKKQGVRDHVIESTLYELGWKKEEIEKELTDAQRRIGKSDDELVAYVRSAREQGIGYDVLKDRLVNSGWDPGAVERTCVLYESGVQQLVQYIFEAQKKGISFEDMKKRLSFSGWKSGEVKKTVGAIEQSQGLSPSSIERYVLNARKRGLTDEAIAERLVHAGWNPQHVESALVKLSTVKNRKQ